MTDLLPFAPISAQVLARQFLGQLDQSPSISPAPAPSTAPPDVGTFLGLPVRQEPFSHRAKPVIPAPPAPQIAAPAVPLIELAVLVPTPLGGVPAFPGDWIVQASDGTWSVYPDVKFRAKFEAASRASQEALSADGSGTGRWGSGDNWTQHGDGTDYPTHGGSFGVPQNAELKPFEAFSDTFRVGSQFRIMKADKSVDPQIHVATAINDGLVTYYESAGKTAEVSRDHVVAVKA